MSHFISKGFVLFILTLYSKWVFCNTPQLYPEKVLICGICQNIENAVPYDIENIEKIGSHFTDYAVIIYENNSKDRTSTLLQKWAKKNNRVTFISERVPRLKLPPDRIEKISRARNIVLAHARDPKYADFKYLIMADLDFEAPWPIKSILESLDLPFEWDCVTANGVRDNGIYYDRYALRYSDFPLGPELLGDNWWLSENIPKLCFKNDEFIPVYSAFGGLAIYKTDSILPFSYSAKVTEDVKQFYEEILLSIDKPNRHLEMYMEINKLPGKKFERGMPVNFFKKKSSEDKSTSCCEHICLHASMILNGFGKIFINPKMFMYYNPTEIQQ